MSDQEVLMSLAKVMIAAAWVDGEISQDEINSMKDLLFRLPDMTATDWAELDIYIDSPIDEAERSRLIVGMQKALATGHDKALAFSALDELVTADGVVTDEEQRIVGEIKVAIDKADVGVFKQMGSLLKGPVKRRTQAVAGAPNRELYLDDFIKNRIYYNVNRRLSMVNGNITLTDSEIRKLSLAGGLMARVAFVDGEVSDEEVGMMIDALQEKWNLSETHATIVSEVAVSEIGKGLDYWRLSREFFECTNAQEREQFLDVLFAVADEDGGVSYNETEEIRTIANVLKLTHKQFIDAKLKIPRERRAE
jgi:uncharacterized tellurite resistance protein B-like protein